MINFTIPIEPKAQMRPRFASRGKFNVAYKDKKQEQSEQNILFYLDKHRPEKPLSGPVSIWIQCHMKRPKSHFRTGKFSGILKDSSPYWHTNTPDIDNFVKNIFDCMNGIFFEDDRQVCSLHVTKLYSEKYGFWNVAIGELEKD